MLFPLGHHQNHGVVADCNPGMKIQLSADDSRDAWAWFAGDFSACDASHVFVLPLRHGLVDACFLATIEAHVNVARQARTESGHGEG